MPFDVVDRLGAWVPNSLQVYAPADMPGGAYAVLLLAALVFALLVVVFLADSVLHFLPWRWFGGAANTGWHFWPKPASQNLVVDAADLPVRLSNAGYAVQVAGIVYNSRSTGRAYRHILHRGAPMGDADAATGLPAAMNPGVFADPRTNDLLVFVDTTDPATNDALRESVRVPNIPMNTPFTLALVVGTRRLEVYINCRLVMTKLLQGKPLPAGEGWFGLAGGTPLTAALRDLRLWNRPVGLALLRDNCATPPTFPAHLALACSSRRVAPIE